MVLLFIFFISGSTTGNVGTPGSSRTNWRDAPRDGGRDIVRGDGGYDNDRRPTQSRHDYRSPRQRGFSESSNHHDGKYIISFP